MADLELVFGVKEKESGAEILRALQGICAEIDTKNTLKVKIGAVLDDKVAGNIAKQIKDAEKAADTVAQKRKTREASAETKKFRELERQYAAHKKRLRELDNQLDRKNLSSQETEQYKKEAAHHARVMGGLKRQITAYKEQLRLKKMIAEVDLKADSSKAHILSGDLRKDSTEYLRLFKETTSIQQQLLGGDVSSDLLGKMSTDYVAKLERMRELYAGIATDQKLLNDLLQKQSLIAKDLDVRGAQVDYKQQQAAARNAEKMYKSIEMAKLKYSTDAKGGALSAEAQAEVKAKEDVLKFLQSQISDTQILYDLEQKRLLIDKEIATKRAEQTGKSSLEADQARMTKALQIQREMNSLELKQAKATTKEGAEAYSTARWVKSKELEDLKEEIKDKNILVELEEKLKSLSFDPGLSASKKASNAAKEAKDLKEYAAQFERVRKLQVAIEAGARGPEAVESKKLLADQTAALDAIRERRSGEEWINKTKAEELRINQELLAAEEKLTKSNKRRAENQDDYSKIYRQISEYIQKSGDAIKSRNKKQYEQLLKYQEAARAGKYDGGADKLAKDIARAQGEIYRTESNVEGFAQRIRRIFSDKYVYGIIAVAAMYARRLVREVYQNVQEIDSAMTQLSIVTGQTGGELEASFDRAANSAKKLGSSITDLLGSMETFARLGYDMDQSQMLAEVATMMSKVAAVDVSEATTGLTSIIKGFGLTPEDAEHVGDVLSNIGKKYAVSAGELMEAFERSGAAFKASGTDFEKATALIAAGNAAVDFCRVA